MSYSIYLVEDEIALNQVLTSYLQKEGWDVKSFTTGSEAGKYIETPPHLWILDIMLPDVDGFDLIHKIKARCKDTPVIFISARDAELDRVIGLEMGSEDYLAKPFLPRELIIRTHKLLERIYPKESLLPSSTLIKVEDYFVDEAKRMVLKGNEHVELTSKEFDLLLLLVKNKGFAFSREKLIHIIWGTDYFGSDRVVDDLMRRLRKKMPDLKIETIYGYGYRMVIQ